MAFALPTEHAIQYSSHSVVLASSESFTPTPCNNAKVCFLQMNLARILASPVFLDFFFPSTLSRRLSGSRWLCFRTWMNAVTSLILHSCCVERACQSRRPHLSYCSLRARMESLAHYYAEHLCQKSIFSLRLSPNEKRDNILSIS